MFRIVILLSILHLTNLPAKAQALSPYDLMKLKPQGIGTHKVDTLRAVYIPMPFSSSHIITAHQLAKIPSPEYVYSVNLVYTRYREVDSFDQPALNLARYKALQAVYPDVFKVPDVQWNVWEQRQATTKAKAERCYHGFVIYLKNIVPPELSAKELETVKSVIDSYHDTLIWVPESIEWKIKRRRVETGYYLPNNKDKRKSGEKFSSRSIWFREPETEVRYDSTIRKKTGGYWQKTGSFDTEVFKGTDEFNLLTRRQWSPKMAVVTDVTGSMSPYSTQVMLWLKYSPEKLQSGRFIFFNDGDATPDMFKKTGATGGLYVTESKSFDSVYKTMTTAMQRGSGGDLPENNLEAVLAAIARWPDTDTVLMIADINAAVKDISLLDKVSKPVNVMLCGNALAVPKDYIDIVKKTGGKLFMFNNEISSLKGFYNGQRIGIGVHLLEWRGNTFNIIR